MPRTRAFNNYISNLESAAFYFEQNGEAIDRIIKVVQNNQHHFGDRIIGVPCLEVAADFLENYVAQAPQ